MTGQEPIPVRVSRKLALEEGLITEYSGARLRMDLDRVPLWPDDHVGVTRAVVVLRAVPVPAAAP